MKLKFCVDEDFVNYKEASMFLGLPYCSFKCDVDNKCQYCQNYYLKDQETLDIDADQICKRYLKNDITKAIVIGGLEPFDTPFDLLQLIDAFRNKHNCDDTIVIYTGYTEHELTTGTSDKEYPFVNFAKLHDCYEDLKKYENIIIKFGRFIPNNIPHYDEILGVNLASNNQYAKKIS